MNFQKDKYLIVKNVISRELADFIYDYFFNKRMVDKTLLDVDFDLYSRSGLVGTWNDSQIPNTYSHYSDIVMETLLQKIKPIIEKYTNLSLIETYSYARIYKKGDTLYRHKDRFSCEISVTLNLGGPAWSIFLDPNPLRGKLENGLYVDGGGKGIEIFLNPGDALIYCGSDLEHWREPYEFEGCAQVFLHYNNILSPNAVNNSFDKRPHIGLPPKFRK